MHWYCCICCRIADDQYHHWLFIRWSIADMVRFRGRVYGHLYPAGPAHLSIPDWLWLHKTPALRLLLLGGGPIFFRRGYYGKMPWLVIGTARRTASSHYRKLYHRARHRGIGKSRQLRLVLRRSYPARTRLMRSSSVYVASAVYDIVS
jgi:hypothetical protein